MNPRKFFVGGHRKAVAAAASVVLIAIIIMVYPRQSFVPPDFETARRESVQIAKVIVENNENSIKNLKEISLYDQRQLYEYALILVRQELDRARDSRSKSVDLAEKLNTMSGSTAGIQPRKARNLVLSAISDELALISRLIVYNDLLQSLLQSLDYKFSGDIRYDAGEVQILIRNMNLQAEEVNGLNNAFNEKMRRFDEVAR